MSFIRFSTALVMAVTACSGLAHASAGGTGGNAAQQSNNLVSQQASTAAATTTVGLIQGAGASALASRPSAVGVATRSGTAYTGNSFSYQGTEIPEFNLRDVMRQNGVAAGGSGAPLGLWVKGAYTSVDSNDTNGEFDGNVYNVSVGADYKFDTPDAPFPIVVGLMGGYENIDIDTTFNRGTFKGDGFTVAPYAAMEVVPQFIIDGTVGYSWLDYDVSRAPLGGASKSGDFDAQRFMASAGATYNHRVDDMRISPRVSILTLRETQDSYTETDGTAVPGSGIDLTRLSFGGEFGYDLGGVDPSVAGVEPYVKLMGEYDIDREDAVDLGGGNFSSAEELGAVAGGGVNIKLTDVPGFGAVSGNLEGTYNTLGRGDVDVWTTSGKIRVEF